MPVFTASERAQFENISPLRESSQKLCVRVCLRKSVAKNEKNFVSGLCERLGGNRIEAETPALGLPGPSERRNAPFQGRQANDAIVRGGSIEWIPLGSERFVEEMETMLGCVVILKN